MNTLVYLVGAPGVGKTSLMRALTGRCDRLTAVGTTVPHDVLLRPREDDENADVAVEVGRRRELFSGTDALSMSINPLAVQWIAAQPHRLVIGEGARLGNPAFLLAARRAGYQVHLIHLTAPDTVLSYRRRARGTRQSEAWMRGAATRASNLADKMVLDVTVSRLTAGRTPEILAERLISMIPELEVLR